MIFPLKVAVSLIPVFVFLIALVFLDSYKLVRFSSILGTIGFGCVAALVSLTANQWILQNATISLTSFIRYAAPVIEEILKASCLIIMIRGKKVGFLVDAAIFGFAVGAGFALVENIYYLWTVENANIALWVVRGFGTAALHGATMIIFGVISKSILDRDQRTSLVAFLPGILVAIIIHSLFNHFIIPPIWSTVIMLVALPIVIIYIYDRSEKITRDWLGKGMDADIELLDMIISDKISQSPIGDYLQTLKDKFPGPVVADMLCFLRIHCELAMGAKGILLMRQAGIDPSDNPDIKAKFEELKYLENSLGKTGKLTILPFLRTSSRDLWQLYMLGK